MLVIESQAAVNILQFFDTLPDPRSTVNRRHRLGDVIVIAICAVLALADGPTTIALWAELHEEWLKKHLALPNGIPSRDTFRRVLSTLNPILFQKCFSDWVNSLHAQGRLNATQRPHIAIDGKSLRRSHDHSAGLGPLQVVSAWASDVGISLGQFATEEKSNEITAIPQLLELIDVKEAIITIDAMGCQKQIADTIIEKQADYVLALKKNHGKLFDDVRLAIDGYLDPDTHDQRVSRYVEIEQKHGRLEARSYFQMVAPSFLHNRSEWRGLKTIGAVKHVFEVNGVEKSEVRYYISSLSRNAELFGRVVRSHWKIENSLHWSLDMTYREDESRVRNRVFAENLAWLRRMTLTLVKQHPRKTSQIMKRRMAGWSCDFMMQVLTGKVT